MIKVNLIIIFLITSLFVFNNVNANEDEAYFCDNEGKKLIDPIEVYVGEDSVNIEYVFGQNSHNWSCELISPIFSEQLEPFIFRDYTKPGYKFGTSLKLNPDAPIGFYYLKIYLNYTDDNERIIKRQFNFTVELKKALEIKKINIPEDKERSLSVDIETFIEFKQLIVEFNSDGDIALENEEIILHDVSKGLYTIETSIYRKDINFGDQQELGFRVIGNFNSRTVFFNDNWTRPVTIEWGEGDLIKNSTQNSTFKSTVLIIGIVIIILILIIYLKNRISKMNK